MALVYGDDPVPKAWRIIIIMQFVGITISRLGGKHGQAQPESQPKLSLPTTNPGFQSSAKPNF